MRGGVGSPGAPFFGLGFEFLLRDIAGGFAKGEVRGREGVGFVGGAHGDVMGGPGSDAGDGGEGRFDVVEALREVDGFEGSGKGLQRIDALGGEADAVEVFAGGLLGSWEAAAVLLHDAMGERAGSGDGDLLAEDGAGGEFESVPTTGYASAGIEVQARVRGVEVAGDFEGVGAEVEDAADLFDDDTEVGDGIESFDASFDGVGVFEVADGDFRGGEVARIHAVRYIFEAGNGAVFEECEDLVPTVRWTVTEA